VAQFSWSCDADTGVVTFNGASSQHETSYEWDLDTEQASGQVVTADYSAAPGPHVVTLVVSGPGGTSDPAFDTVTCP
jgi:PKD repeat protein